MRDYTGKTAFITGGSAGIGLELAKLLAARGANVFIFARTRERLESAVAAISASQAHAGQWSRQARMDVADPASVRSALEAALLESAVPDILVNCAGRALPDYFENITDAQLHETMSINFFGLWYVTKALLPHLKRRGGTIVNVSSTCGLMGVFGYTDYCAAKHAVTGFSEALRSEVKRYGIEVAVVCPPDTDTPGFAVENRHKPEETRAVSRGTGLLSPRVVAQAIVRGLERHERVILPGAAVRWAALLKRWLPGLVERSMDHAIRNRRRPGKP